MKNFTAALLIIAVITVVGCNNQASIPAANKDTIPALPPKETGLQGGFSAQTSLTFDSINIKKFLDSFPQFKNFEKDITGFYRSRKYAYAWFDEKGLIENANNLLNRINNIKEEGLPDSIPYKAELTNLMESTNGTSNLSPTLELMLTSQYLAYAKKVWVGISEEESLATDWLLPRKKLSSEELLDSLVNGKNVLENSPVFKQYNLLKECLRKYNNINEQTQFAKITPGKKSYRPGDSSVTISTIRERLFLLGDLSADSKSPVFDSALQTGATNFQHRMGYKEDGIIGAAFLAAINYPIDKRIEQILVNMERSRWIPVQLKSDYLLINIPEFKLHVYEHDSLAFDMNVVVGKAQHKTVIFNGDMKYIVFSPYWNIPASIMKNETLPALRRNPRYLAQHNMEWSNGGIRQKPGPDNSLGLVKFLFPNNHSIYLHDTPAKSLFNEDSRAFSHGCIRLSEPKKLAIHLLKNDSAWTAEKITAAMNKGVEKYVTLKQPVPVFIAYFTAWVDRQGKLNFRDDIYDRNSRLAKMILKKPAI